jgi:hypothetical protein
VIATSINGLLGHSALMIGLVASLFGALALGYATVTNDRRLLRTVPNYAWMAGAAGVLASAFMMNALLTFDFDLAYVQDVGSRTTPTLFNIAAMWSALEGSILLWLMVLAGYTVELMRRYRKRLDDPLIAWALVVMFVISAFFFFLAFGPTDVFATGAPGVTDGRAQPAAAEPHPRDVPPADPVPRLRRLHGAVRVRDRRAHHRPCRRGLAHGDPPLGAHHVGFLSVGILLGGWWSYEVLGWSGVWAWDPGRERELPAVAHRHRVHPLGARAGAPRHAPRLEHQPARRHVLAHDPRHVPHPQRGHQQCARVRRRLDRTVAARLLRRHGRRVARAHRLARRSPALAGRDRLTDLARGRVPGEQRDLHGLRLRRAARHRVPAR